MVEEEERTGDAAQPARSPEPDPGPAPSPGPPPLRALDVDGFGVIGVGTAVFAVLSVVTVLDRVRLRAEGHGWWIGVALVGVALGLLALGYAGRRRRSRR